MAYFECTIGGASGDGVALIIECASSFAGSTITADNGEDVFSETCPSVSPYTVRFEGIPTGTYTISGVSGGTTITKQFTVLDYTTTLHVIPNGSTVTPVNDIQIWLHCADIWDKNYTTIAQVLADASTLQALIASNNAADYMARSTSWASNVTANANAMTYIGANNYCANKLLANSTWCNAICNSTYFESVLNVKVPTMTSNTTPYGTASASTDRGGYEAYKALDGNDSTFWWSTQYPSNSPYIEYDFANSVCVRAIGIRDNSGASTVTIKGDNGNNTWAIVADNVPCNNSTNIEIQNFINNTHYLKYRVYPKTIASSSNNWAIYTLQFYGRA